MAHYRVVVIDRPAWYQPALEQEELSRIGAEVVVGWARLGEPKELGPTLAQSGLSVESLSLYGSSYIDAAKHDADVIARMAGDADAIVVTTARITPDVMDRLPRLRVIGRPGVGYDIVDVEAATDRGIAVFNAPGFCAREVADHTMMLVLACTRKAPSLYNAMRKGIYERGLASQIAAAYDLTLGFVAFGNIPREVALRARPFGFNLLAFDPYVSQEVAGAYDVKMVDLDELLRRSDVISVHAPLTRQTRHLLGAREFQLMKSSACVVSTARGPVIDQKALIAALETAQIAGAGLDVFEREPLESDSPLLAMDNVFLTPHIAGASMSSAMAVKQRTARNIANALMGMWTPTRDLVNPEVMSRLKPAT